MVRADAGGQLDWGEPRQRRVPDRKEQIEIERQHGQVG
jgi:hypothetical protein